MKIPSKLSGIPPSLVHFPYTFKKHSSTKAPSKQAKKEKINQYSGDVKQNFIFLAPKYQDKQYQKAMDELTTFVYIGDNEHDDAADGVTQLAITLAGKRFAEVKATKNFMWGRR